MTSFRGHPDSEYHFEVFRRFITSLAAGRPFWFCVTQPKCSDGTLFHNINFCLLCFHEKLLLFLESSWTTYLGLIKKGLKNVFAIEQMAKLLNIVNIM